MLGVLFEAVSKRMKKELSSGPEAAIMDRFEMVAAVRSICSRV